MRAKSENKYKIGKLVQLLPKRLVTYKSTNKYILFIALFVSGKINSNQSMIASKFSSRNVT